MNTSSAQQHNSGHSVDIQIACTDPDLPAESEWRSWVEAALADRSQPAEVCIRVVDSDESARLNQTYRGKSGPTNVLSFGAEIPAGIDSDLLGDIVICAPRVREEADAQHKTVQQHWAHLTVHGVLHLLGFDHENDDDAERMEQHERDILARLGIDDPYRERTEYSE